MCVPLRGPRWAYEPSSSLRAWKKNQHVNFFNVAGRGGAAGHHPGGCRVGCCRVAFTHGPRRYQPWSLAAVRLPSAGPFLSSAWPLARAPRPRPSPAPLQRGRRLARALSRSVLSPPVYDRPTASCDDALASIADRRSPLPLASGTSGRRTYALCPPAPFKALISRPDGYIINVHRSCQRAGRRTRRTAPSGVGQICRLGIRSPRQFPPRSLPNSTTSLRRH